MINKEIDTIIKDLELAMKEKQEDFNLSYLDKSLIREAYKLGFNAANGKPSPSFYNYSSYHEYIQVLEELVEDGVILGYNIYSENPVTISMRLTCSMNNTNVTLNLIDVGKNYLVDNKDEVIKSITEEIAELFYNQIKNRRRK